MFGNKKDSTEDNTLLEQVGTIIGPGAVIDGPLTTKDSTRIDGTIKGNVTVSGALIIGQEGKVVGTISALNVYVAGEVNGNIATSQGKIEISDTGKVIGDITCKGIIIDENAVFQGKCEMTGIDKNSAEVAKERAVADKESSDVATATSSEEESK
ncbi:protein CcmA, bactofilin family [Butyrivibrio sp. INlla18]|uniref:bactofilin family protein n=1 Tax=Butyrivibrio sp. INlla18 TaxID=1520806 RepID=UPI00087E4278|nr:polymer-forming cytoskeletal protein [Butyrivibrio sp. INlla18]SDA48405.1 protein CcmA, bactofilin family [Butyrivibrio sp. INlla18]